ncbi:MAG: hypothetical protein O3C28_11785 [Proteobacteria bacterium]|jgi:RNA-binding protein YhbY|nr:hypothetical protein [Pseudomonadota bacterium]
MNEYEITISEEGIERTLIVEAETAAQARDLAEDLSGEEVVKVRFVRAISFSCRTRGSTAVGR